MVQSETANLENFEKLLDEFEKLPERVERPRTFMEIAGYPHYENVCSNILAFFMDPEEPHGLGTLVLDALTRASSISDVDEGFGGNVSIEREVNTDVGNRIDILITSDDHAILVENKIYASVNNPFADYTDYLDRIANGRVKRKILLTVSSTSEGKDSGFANLVYEKFLEQIRSLLGRYVSSADTRYLTMFLDFLNTLEDLNKGTRMDPEIVNLISDRREDIEKLLIEVRRFQDEMRYKVQTLGQFIDVGEYQKVAQRVWRPRTGLIDMLIYDITFWEGQRFEVAAIVSPEGWKIRLQLLPRDASKLRALLESVSIPFEETGQVEGQFIHTERFDYNEDLRRIKPALQDIVGKIAKSREREMS